MKIFFLILLVTFVGCTITTTTNSTTLSSYCAGSPYWNLNQCNVTCSTCSTCLSSDQSKCLTCESNYTLSSVYCTLSNDTYTYILQQYFTSTTVSSSDLTVWYNSGLNKKLTTSNTVSICSASNYNFGMVGMFTKDDKLNIQLTYTNQMNYITIKFRLLLLLNNANLEVDLAQKSIYTKTFSSLSDIDATYYSSTSDTSSSYLNIPSLSSSNIGTVMQLIQFDTAIATKDINLYITASASSTSAFWAISDVSILLRQCDTCPTAQLMATVSSLGSITLYTTAVVVPLLVLFYLTTRLKQYFEKLNFRSRKGGKSLPMKAINRVQSIIAMKWSHNDQSKEKRTSLLQSQRQKNEQTLAAIKKITKKQSS